MNVFELLLFMWKSVHHVCGQVGDVLCLLFDMMIKFVDSGACL